MILLSTCINMTMWSAMHKGSTHACARRVRARVGAGGTAAAAGWWVCGLGWPAPEALRQQHQRRCPAGDTDTHRHAAMLLNPLTNAHTHFPHTNARCRCCFSFLLHIQFYFLLFMFNFEKMISNVLYYSYKNIFILKI